MKCEDFLTIYHNALRGELSPDELKLLNDHTAICESCRYALKWDTAIGSTLKRAEPPVPLKDITFEVMKQISVQNSSSYKAYWFLYAIAAAASITLAFFIYDIIGAYQQNVVQWTHISTNAVITGFRTLLTPIMKWLSSQEVIAAVTHEFAWIFWLAFGVISSFFSFLLSSLLAGFYIRIPFR